MLEQLGKLRLVDNSKDVAAAFDVNRSTIIRIRQHYVKTGSVEDRPRSRKPRVTSQRTDRAIRLTHLRPWGPATETDNETPGRNRPRINPRCRLTLPPTVLWCASYKMSSC